MLLIKKNNRETETSCGYAEVPMDQLYENRKLKLEIKGGTPSKGHSLSKEDIRAKRSGFAKFTGIFSGSVKSQLIAKFEGVKEFKKAEMEDVLFLPVVGFFPKMGLKPLSIYRQIAARELLDKKNPILRANSINVPIIGKFCRIVDCIQSYKAFVETYKKKVLYCFK